MLKIQTIGGETKYNIKGRYLENGKIYESEMGNIFIGNGLILSDGRRFTAFSIDGTSVVNSDTSTMYREVDATITVTL